MELNMSRRYGHRRIELILETPIDLEAFEEAIEDAMEKSSEVAFSKFLAKCSNAALRIRCNNVMWLGDPFMESDTWDNFIVDVPIKEESVALSVDIYILIYKAACVSVSESVIPVI